jgi:hypothetical protein
MWVGFATHHCSSAFRRHLRKLGVKRFRHKAALVALGVPSDNPGGVGHLSSEVKRASRGYGREHDQFYLGQAKR